jgi:small subunit ribosomal protein S9
VIIVNNKKLEDYFDANGAALIKQPLKLTSSIKDNNFYIQVKGGGKIGQAEAVRYAICKTLLETEEALRPSLKAKGWLTRDARKKERKKPGLKKARRAPQWSKR